MRSFRFKHLVLAVSMLAVALMCGSFTAWSQATSGNIAGTVVDKSGSVIPNASVTATNVATLASQRRHGPSHQGRRFQYPQPACRSLQRHGQRQRLRHLHPQGIRSQL